MISVEPEKCRHIADRCSALEIRKDFYNREFLSFDADRETKLRVYLFAAAICHQTHRLHHPGLNLWGWDYLEYGFLKILKERNVLINPGYLGICKVEDIRDMLLSAFSPDGKPENCTLDRTTERAEMLFDICQDLKRNYNSKVSNLIDAAGGRLIHEGAGLYDMLSRFSAFEDPFRKKITFFVKLAVDAGVLMIRDPENIIPIMDYHMQRVLLRMGCVRIDDENMMADLVARKPLKSDQEVRKACIEAMRILAAESGHGILKMNDIFWPLGRSCCNETTLCYDRRCMKSPCSFTVVSDITGHHQCYFEEVCRGSKESSYRDLWEPVVETTRY